MYKQFMKNLVNLMISLEQKSAEFYFAASECFKDNHDIRDFLMELSAEEAQHHKIMKDAANVIEEMDYKAHFTLDDSTKEFILSTFSNAADQAKQKCITVEKLFEIIVNIEFSEWNGLFYYIVSNLKDKNPKFKMAAIHFQQHLRTIQRHVGLHNSAREPMNRLKSIPPIWNESILVVDDTEAITRFLEVLLKTEGNVDIADNGKSAMDLLDNKFYAAIISDIAMPQMDGFAFYNEAVKKYSSVKDRFIFFSSETSESEVNFINENSVRFIQKPGNIKIIRDTVFEVISTAASLKKTILSAATDP